MDSEVVIGKLLSSKYTKITTPETADLIVINTCCFIDEAIQETESWINRLVQIKREDSNKTLMVIGCYPQRYGKQLSSKYPEVDYWIGVNDFPFINEILTQKNRNRVFIDNPPYLYNEKTERFLSTPSHYAYLKITEGCNHQCSYCVIPSIRGKQRSRQIESVQKEALQLIDQGVKEIILIGQDIGHFGLDWSGKKELAHLLKRLDHSLPNGIWIRLLYLSPESMNQQLIETIATSEKICKYLDVPLQHTHPFILQKMNRPSNIDKTFKILNTLRKTIPGLFLRTTLIVGFPGETDAIFNQMVSTIKSFRFERLGCFVYSPQSGTPASQLPHQVEDEIKQNRYHQIMKIQKKIAHDFHRSLIGKTLEVILDQGPLSQKPRTFLGRTYGDAPDVDGQIKVIVHKNSKTVQPGDILKVTINKSSTYDLEGIYS
ncbi:MAG: 30S ribosomal protein S12 methylthiotransferase RimO [Candidatus Atribacteria bacterium]|nr:30S ribosomal protein S12 methylthiotransferase RimO [Candidatus Atribacteria bacterium]